MHSNFILAFLYFVTMLSVLKKYKLLPAGNFAYESSVHKTDRENFFNERFQYINKIHTWGIVPLLGILIPLYTGLLRMDNKSGVAVLFHIAFYIAVALIIYKGNIFLMRHFRMELRDSNMPYGRLILLYFFTNISYSTVVAIAFLSTWNNLVNHEAPFDRDVMITMLIVLGCVLVINNVYELLFLNIENKMAGRKMKELETEKQRAMLDALNSQVDPHFLYNALNTLSYLLTHDPEKANQYNQKLAAMYSYVLSKKNCDTVPLEEELEFCQNYFCIQQLRFGNTVQMTIAAPGAGRGNAIQVPPLSVQTLVENAFKHNVFSDVAPLIITVSAESDCITVTNTLKAKKNGTRRNGTGLLNLDNRLQFIGKTSLKVVRTEHFFSVSFPVIQ